jgi:single-strand DNA-binding protein
MASLNQCNFIGNVGNIETRFMPNGEGVTNLSLAVNEKWTTKEGEKKERCEWVRCVIYGKLSGIADMYVKAGAALYVSGKQRTREWEKDGVKRFSTEIIVSELQMLDRKPDSDQKPAPQQAPSTNQAPASNFDEFEDSNPF